MLKSKYGKNMLLPELIKKALIRDLHINFSVSQKNDSIYITEDEDTHRSFYLNVQYSEADRLTIVCEPDKYGVSFVDTISSSTKEQRKVFCNYWEKLTVLNSKMEITLNDRLITPEEFCNFNEPWKKIRIRFTKIPFYNEETQNRNEKLIDYIELVCAMVLSLCVISYTGEVEGNLKLVVSRQYERNPINRKLCLMLKGYRCSVCGFDFEKFYGPLGKNYIEVHHLIPVSTMGDNYQVDPVNDLVPLCSNCHSMVHRKSPPYSVEELINIIKSK